MKVNPSTTHSAQSSETSSSKKASRSSAASESASANRSSKLSDSYKAELSDRAREMSRAKEVANSAPDVREDRVAALKRKIADGSYRVDADAIAEKMFDDHLKTGGA